MASKSANNLLHVPPGFHFVRGHYRCYRSGIIVWVSEHIARNPGKKTAEDTFQTYSAQDLKNLFQNSKKKYPSLGKICGFAPNDHLDDMIQFWLDHWKQRGLKFPDDLTPRHVKAMIAKESSFNPKAKAYDKNTARGLMQLKDDTRQFLAGYRKEIKKEKIDVSPDDLDDPLVNIACGTRWLARKYELVPKKAEKNAFNVVKAYNEWNEKGDAYAKKVFEMANKTCP